MSRSARSLALGCVSALATIAALTTPSRADPIITPLVLGGLAAAGVTGTAATVTAGIVSALIITGIGIGLSLLFAPKPPKPENGTVPAQEPLTYRIYGYGTARVPGATVLKEESNGFLGVVNVLNAHRVDSFEEIYLNDDQVQVGSDNPGQLGGYVGMGSDGRYEKNRVSVDTRLGNAPEAPYDIIIALFGDVWDDSYRGDGCASIAMLCAPAPSKEFATTYPYGAPQISPVINQYAVFDPRNGQTYFSKNPALCILHFQCTNPFGPRRDYATAVVPNLNAWIQAANDCDAPVLKKDGSNEPRYQLGGYTTTEQDRNSTLQAMLTTCDGFFVERGDGTIDLKVGVYRSPTVTLTDDDIIGFYVQRDVASEDVINSATCKWTSPDNAYATVETDPVVNQSDVQNRPGPPRSSQMDATWCQSNGQASRLLAREMSRQSEKTRGTLTCKLSALNAMYERWIQVSSNTVPRMGNMVIENQKPTVDVMRQRVTIQFVSSGPQVDAYDPSTQESSPPIIPTRPSNAGLPIPTNVSASPTQSNDPTGNSTVYLTVSWDVPIVNGAPLGGQNYVVQIRTSDVGDGPGSWTQQEFDNPTIEGNRIVVQTATVPVNTELDVQVSTLGTYSLGTASPIIQVSTALTPSPPGPVTGVSATGGSGQATVQWTNPTSTNFASAQVYRGPYGGGFAGASPVGPRQYGASGAQASYIDGVAAGRYVYFVVALSQVGAAATPAGPVVANVT